MPCSTLGSFSITSTLTPYTVADDTGSGGGRSMRSTLSVASGSTTENDEPFPGSERILTLAEVQEVQTRLTKAGFDTGGTDGQVGNDTMQAIKDFQTRTGLLPADGYGGLKVLARLRQGN